MSPLSIIIGIVASVILQFVKTNPKFTFLTPEMNKTLQAAVVVVGVVGAIAQASSVPGGLAALPWQELLKQIFDNMSIIIGSAVLFYQHMLRPAEKAAAKESAKQQ